MQDPAPAPSLSVSIRPHRPRRAVALAVLIATAATATIGAALVTAPPAGAVASSSAVTGRVSVTRAEAELPQTIGDMVFTDTTGRYVTFTTDGALQPDDTNGVEDVYLRDRVAGTTRRVSTTDAEVQIGGPSDVCGMSRNARFVAFVAFGTGLPVPATYQVYVRDRSVGTTSIVSVSSAEVPSTHGAESGVWEDQPCPISDDGRYVAFVSEAPALAGGDANGDDQDVFRRDRTNGTTDRVSQSTGAAGGTKISYEPDLSADGQTVAFASLAPNLVAADTNGKWDVFVRLEASSQTVRVSVKAGSGQILANNEEPSLSADGTKVAFRSAGTDVVAGDTNASDDVFVRNRTTGTVVRASLRSNGTAFPGISTRPTLSDDGRYVAFSTWYPDDLPGDLNHNDDVYRRDLDTSTTEGVSVTHAATTGNDQAYLHEISGDGTVVPFVATASDLVRHDQNNTDDVFARDFVQETTPFATDAALVARQFLDLEGRPATAAELAEWTARLSNGETTPDLVIDDLLHGTTFAGKRAPLIRLYWAYFHRAPDVNGLEYWTKKLKGGSKLALVAKQFATSSEFQTKYGSKTNLEFVTLIYQNIFERDPDPQGLAYWTKKLDTMAKTRGDVMVNFSESSEGTRVLAPQTDTILTTLGMLGRVPSKLYLDLVIGNVKGEWLSVTQVITVRGGSEYATRVAS